MIRSAFAALSLAALTAACSPAREAEPAAAPEAAAAPAASPDVHAFRVGALEAHMLRDGQLAMPAERVFPDQPQLGQTLAAAGLPEDQVSLSVQPMLVKAGERVMLFDAGVGPGLPAMGGKLPQSLAAAGIRPEQVTDVFISHGHFDHLGGVASAEGTPMYPNATIHMAEAEWAAVQANPETADVAKAVASRVKTFQPGSALIPGVVTAVAVEGHTAGHSAYEITSGGERLLYIGDSAHHSVVSLAHPEWRIQFDQHDPAEAAASRRALLQRAVQENIRIASPHFPYPGLGRVRAEGEGFAWVAE